MWRDQCSIGLHVLTAPHEAAYRSIEDGVVELDDILRKRTSALKAQPERVKAALDHACARCGTAAAIELRRQRASPLAALGHYPVDRSAVFRRSTDAVSPDAQRVLAAASKL